MSSARLAGKTILITGASSGIGRSCAFEFARANPTVRLILTARRLETLKEVADQIKKEISKTTEVLPIKFDVANPEEVRSFMDNLPEGWKNIDVLVNNAGLVKGVDKVGDILEEDITTMVTTNVLGLIGVCTELHRVCPSLSELRRVEPRIMRLGN
jgi:3-hydroxy acid dehydrogenase/malonic semialdehyde reductase